LEERVGAALSARTRTELAALVADLPGRLSGRPARPTPPPSRWALLQSLIDAWAPTGSPGLPATVG
jgi:hypothetical protein